MSYAIKLKRKDGGPDEYVDDLYTHTANINNVRIAPNAKSAKALLRRWSQRHKEGFYSLDKIFEPPVIVEIAIHEVCVVDPDDLD